VNKKKETITKDGLSSVTEYSEYNSAGAPGKIIEPSGVVETIRYDGSNLPRFKKRTDPASDFTQTNFYEYFLNNLTLQDDLETNLKRYTYLNGNKDLIETLYEQEKYLLQVYNYNSNGQLISEKELYYIYMPVPGMQELFMGEKRDKASYVYDRLGNLTESKYGSDGTANWQKKEYDAN
ncbi:hypothetical protein ODQ17_19160, partial [Acinetobacter sp. IRS14]|uniref:hypothetical protein n=1 Tax=Acinetobacter sp. IRS14 TaxID=2983398 RepID=UPI002AFF8151